MNLREFIEDKKWCVASGEEVIDVWRLLDYLNEKEQKGKCSACEASMKQFWHRLTPGLVQTLVKVYAKVSEKRQNVVDINELKLSNSEYNNFQKLRFHALIAKYRVEGEWQRGSWLITSRGAEFLKGNLAVPVRVKTFRNRVIDHDEELVNLRDVMKSHPYFEVKFDYDLSRPTLF